MSISVTIIGTSEKSNLRYGRRGKGIVSLVRVIATAIALKIAVTAIAALELRRLPSLVFMSLKTNPL
jgi:hypothetical protein